MTAAGPEFYARARRRIGWLTLSLGLAAAAAVAFLVSPWAALGVAAGTLLAWLNYRWLDQGTGALASAAKAQQEGVRRRVPLTTTFALVARYLLIGLCVYVIVTRLPVPLLSVLTGLLALGAAAMAEGLYEVFFPNR